MGVVLGCSYTVRYFSGAEAVALVLLFVWWRRLRDAVVIAVTSGLVCALLFAVPAGFHVSVFAGGYDTRLLVFQPLNPLRMLGGATDLALVPSRTHTSIGAYVWGLRHKSRLIP